MKNIWWKGEARSWTVSKLNRISPPPDYCSVVGKEMSDTNQKLMSDSNCCTAAVCFSSLTLLHLLPLPCLHLLLQLLLSARGEWGSSAAFPDCCLPLLTSLCICTCGSNAKRRSICFKRNFLKLLRMLKVTNWRILLIILPGSWFFFLLMYHFLVTRIYFSVLVFLHSKNDHIWSDCINILQLWLDVENNSLPEQLHNIYRKIQQN